MADALHIHARPGRVRIQIVLALTLFGPVGALMALGPVYLLSDGGGGLSWEFPASFLMGVMFLWVMVWSLRISFDLLARHRAGVPACIIDGRGVRVPGYGNDERYIDWQDGLKLRAEKQNLLMLPPKSGHPIREWLWRSGGIAVHHFGLEGSKDGKLRAIAALSPYPIKGTEGWDRKA